MSENPINDPEEKTWIGPLNDGKKFGYLDWAGNWVLEIECDDLGDFHESLAPFVREERIGFVDVNGREIIRPAFTTHAIVLPGFREGLAPVLFEGRGTYIDINGELITPPGENPLLWNFINGKALICTFGPRFTVVDRDWTELSVIEVRDIPFYFDFPADWDCFPCIADGDMEICRAYINWKGEFVFPPIYFFVGPWNDGIGPFSPDGIFFGIVRLAGEVVVPPMFRTLSAFSDGLAVAAIEQKKVGFVDITGKWVISPQFRQALPFCDGLACVTVPGKFQHGNKGYINRAGEMVIPPRYDRQTSFHDGWARVEFKGKTQVIDKKGNIIWEA